MKRLVGGTLCLITVTLLWVVPPSAARADDTSDLHFDASLYVWMASLKGDVAAISGAPAVDVDASFHDILENTDLTAMFAFDLRYRRVGFLADFLYLALEVDEQTRGPFFGGAELDSTTFFTSLTPYFRAVEQDGVVLDLMAGARIWYVDTEIKLKPGLLAGRKDSDDESWVDPVLGARGNLKLLDWLSLTAGGDLGGFGAASSFTWQLLGTLDARPVDWLSVRAGYRHLDVDYDVGGFEWDVAMSGPIVGLGLRF